MLLAFQIPFGFAACSARVIGAIRWLSLLAINASMALIGCLGVWL